MLAVSACASIRSSKQFSNACPQGVDSKPFRSDESLALAGQYELTMISQWEDDRGKIVSGHIELWEPDTLFQHYEPSWYAKFDPKSGFRLLPRDSITSWVRSSGWRPLIGVIDLDLRALSLPASNRLQSRDPFEPGVRLEGSELRLAPLLLGFVQFDGNSTSLTVERTWGGGFSGRWKESGWGVIVRNGRELPDPSGVFCARRVNSSGSALH